MSTDAWYEYAVLVSDARARVMDSFDTAESDGDGKWYAVTRFFGTLIRYSGAKSERAARLGLIGRVMDDFPDMSTFRVREVRASVSVSGRRISEISSDAYEARCLLLSKLGRQWA